MTIPDGKEVCTTHCDCQGPVNKENGGALLQPYIHEQVDTCLTVHALDISLSGQKQIKIRRNATDMVLLAISDEL